MSAKELATHLNINVQRLRYHRKVNKMPYFRESGVRVRYLLSDVTEWTNLYSAVKSWGDLSIFRVYGIQENRIPKIFLKYPKWVYLHFTEIFGIPWNRKSNDSLILKFIDINHQDLLKEALSERELKIYQSRTCMNDQDSQCLTLKSYEYLRLALNENVSRQMLQKVFKRAKEKVKIAYYHKLKPFSLYSHARIQSRL